MAHALAWGSTPPTLRSWLPSALPKTARKMAPVSNHGQQQATEEEANALESFFDPVRIATQR